MDPLFFYFLGRSYENRLIHSIWCPVGFPGSFSHCSSTWHDVVYSAFHCSSSAVVCFWKDGLWRDGLRPLSVFPLLPQGFHICSPVCSGKRQRKVLSWAKGALTPEVPRKPKNTCEVTASFFGPGFEIHLLFSEQQVISTYFTRWPTL